MLLFRSVLKFDESKIHREPKGTDKGGQFASALSMTALGLKERAFVDANVGSRNASYYDRLEDERNRIEDLNRVQEKAQEFRGAPPRAKGFSPNAARDAADEAAYGGVHHSPIDSVDHRMSGGVNASYRVTLEDGTVALAKPEAGEAWEGAFTNHDISSKLTNKDFSLAEREAMASEVSKGLGFGQLVPETALRQDFDNSELGGERDEDDDEGGGYDEDYARELYDEYVEKARENDNIWDDVAGEMDRLYREAQTEHVADIEKRHEEITDIWNELIEDYPEETPYGAQSALREHPAFPLGSKPEFERRGKHILSELDPLEVLDEADVDVAAAMNKNERERVREYLKARLDEGYRELGDVDESAAEDHLDHDKWREEHEDTEMRIRDSVIEKNIQTFTQWRHSQGMHSGDGGGGGGIRNPDAPHPSGGSLQRFMEGASQYGNMEFADATKMAVLDYALGTMDRHSGNLLFRYGKPVAIDNGYSMPDDDVDEFTFRSIAVREWKHMDGHDTVPEALRAPIREALTTTDWAALAARHPNMTEGERDSFLGRIERLKDAMTYEDGLWKVWKNMDLMG